MTYLQFHLVFILPPLLALAATAGPHLRRLGPRALRGLLLMPVVALVYTTPWDNYVIWRGIWSYGADRVVGTIGLVPVEEYLFFVLQPLVTGLWTFRFLGEPDPAARRPLLPLLGYLAIVPVAALLLGVRSFTYLALILVWAAPVLALQAGYGARELYAHRRALAIGVAVPTIYLWIADAIAIHLGVWRISAEHTVGLALGPLPLEEAVFFLVTNLLVVQGLILFVARPVPALARG